MVNANGNINVENFRSGFGEERIKKIANELVRRRTARKDYVAPRAKLGVEVTDEATPRLALTVQNGERKVIPFTRASLGQIVGSLDLGVKFADSMTQRGHLDIVAGVMGELLSRESEVKAGTPRKHLIRELDNEVDGFLSDSYRAISNETILTVTMEEAEKVGAEVWDFKLTPTHFEIDLIAPGLRARVENLLKGQEGNAHAWAKHLDKDFHNAALKIGNSENGHGRFYGDLGLWREACRNLAIMQRGITRVHLGSKLKEGTIDWSDETKEMEDKLIASKLRDIVKTAFDPVRFKKLIDSVSATTARTIEDASAIEVVDATIKLHKIDEARRDAILERFLGAGLGKTQYALAQAVTATVNPENAKDASDEERSALEVAGGKVLALGEAQWRAFLRQAIQPKTEDEAQATQAVNVVRS